jgi:hypothetical protein
MQTLIPLIALAAVWFGCSIINLIWLKHYPDVTAEEFRPTLIVLAPLASIIVVLGLAGVWLYNLPLRAMCVNKQQF